MKVICNRGALLEALSVTGSVIAPRTPKPVLQCVKLTAADDRLTIAATDLEVAVRYSDAQVQIEQAGETLVPADKMRDIVRESVDDTLSIEITGDTANIRGQDSHFKIFTQKASEFPPVPDFEGEPDIEIPGGALKQLIGQTIFATQKDATRYAFNGVLFAIKGKKLALVSTDGRRLAMSKGDLSSDKLANDGAKIIVPTKALNLLDKLIADPDELVGMQVRENQVMFHTSSATLTTNLVEGQFPPYDDVIPKDADKKMSAATADFLGAIRRAALLTTEESKGVRLQFTKKGLVLTSRSPESGEATVNFPCKYEGADVEIGFNPTFLTDALRVVDSDEVSLELSAPNRPGLLRGGANFLYVIMPVNLQ
ncbi:MAG TPA: DNA polymerase III subunit beta [Tepidisphaeraceae bacterium]|jgi:DNA polymerase-3 subunit beta|nr:DNA polymerase III subunit beta [Tepidisphaeraceae bacterium]